MSGAISKGIEYFGHGVFILGRKTSSLFPSRVSSLYHVHVVVVKLKWGLGDRVRHLGTVSPCTELLTNVLGGRC